MYKLVILIEPLNDWLKFEAGWPEFLAVAESMPGLKREATSRVDRIIFGKYPVSMSHELFFDSMDELKSAVNSPEGQLTGQILQRITGGNFTLYMADHLEDELTNIHEFAQAKDDDNVPPGNKA